MTAHAYYTVASILPQAIAWGGLRCQHGLYHPESPTGPGATGADDLENMEWSSIGITHIHRLGCDRVGTGLAGFHHMHRNRLTATSNHYRNRHHYRNRNRNHRNCNHVSMTLLSTYRSFRMERREYWIIAQDAFTTEGSAFTENFRFSLQTDLMILMKTRCLIEPVINRICLYSKEKRSFMEDML